MHLQENEADEVEHVTMAMFVTGRADSLQPPKTIKIQHFGPEHVSLALWSTVLAFGARKN